MEEQKKGVRLENISKIYTDPKTGKEFYAVEDITLDIQPGTFVTLLGPSGCGKTTTLRMIAGFESPDRGEIYLGGEAINSLTPNKRDTAMVFQSYALLPHYNVFDNVAYGLKIRKLPREEIRRRVLDILKLVEMEGMESRMTNQLSGGQQQRVALARALVLEPGVLLFDEDEREVKHRLPFDPLADPALLEVLERDDSGVQFSHTLEEQIRGQLKAGFALLDLYEDTNGSGFLHDRGVPTFWATLTEKR